MSNCYQPNFFPLHIFTNSKYFSAEEIVDVTKRYTRNWADILTRRTSVSEEWLHSTILQMNAKKQMNLPGARKDLLKQRFQLEMQTMQMNLEKEQQIREEEMRGRISGSEEWKKARGETGNLCATTISPTSSPYTKSVFQYSDFESLKDLKLIGSSQQFSNR